MKLVKVVHIISSNGMYGAEYVVLNLLKSLRKDESFSPELICLKSSQKANPQLYYKAGKEQIRSCVVNCRSVLDIQAIFRIAGYLKDKRIDIIHSHGFKADFYGLLASKLAGIKSVNTLHGWTGENRKIRIYEYLNKKMMRFNCCTVAVSRQIYNEARQYKNQSKIAIIENGIDTDRFNPHRSDASLPEALEHPGKILVGTVGRLSHEKGQSFLLKAFARVKKKFPDTMLVISGDGALRQNLQQLAAELGIENAVIFTGVIQNIESVYSAIDLFVLPSLTEGVPLVLLEAMSMNLPVIASRVGGIPDIVTSKNAILVSPGDEDELYAALCEFLIDDVKMKSTGEASRTHVLNNFSFNKTYQSYRNIYSSLAGRTI